MQGPALLRAGAETGLSQRASPYLQSHSLRARAQPRSDIRPPKRPSTPHTRAPRRNRGRSSGTVAALGRKQAARVRRPRLRRGLAPHVLPSEVVRASADTPTSIELYCAASPPGNRALTSGSSHRRSDPAVYESHIWIAALIRTNAPSTNSKSLAGMGMHGVPHDAHLRGDGFSRFAFHSLPGTWTPDRHNITREE